MTSSAEGAIGGHAEPSPEPVCLVTRFAAVDDSAARGVSDELRAIAVSVVAEPGHLSYEIFADQDDPRNFYVIETWAGISHARRHEDLVLDNGAVERVVPLLTDAPRTLTLRPITTDNPTRQPASDTGQAGFNDKEAEQQ